MQPQGDSTQQPITHDLHGNEEVSQLRSFKKDAQAIKDGKDYRFTESTGSVSTTPVKAGDLGLKEVEPTHELPRVPVSSAKNILEDIDNRIMKKEETLQPKIHVSKKIEVKPEIKKILHTVPLKEETPQTVESTSESSTMKEEMAAEEKNETEKKVPAEIHAIQKATIYVRAEIEREAKKLEELEVEEAKLEEKNKIEEQEIQILRREQETLVEEKKLEEGELERIRREKASLEKEKLTEEESMSEIERELKRVKLEKKHQEEELRALKETEINLESRKKEIEEERKRQGEIMRELQLVKDDLEKAEEYINRAKKDIEHNQAEEVNSYTEGKTATPHSEELAQPVETLQEAYSASSASSPSDPIVHEREEIDRIKREIAERKKKQQEELEALRKQRSGEVAEKETESEPIKRNTEPEFPQQAPKHHYVADPYREPLEE